MDRVLVAGASGVAGTALVDELRARGTWVRALVRDPARMRVDVDEIFVGDVLYPSSLIGVCDRVDAVVSCVGAKVGWRGFSRDGSFQDVDDAGNRRLLAEAVRAKVKRFGYVSVYGGRLLGAVEYIRAHESFVAALIVAGVDHFVVRPTGLFAAYGRVLRAASRGSVRLVGDGSATTNPLDERDLAVVVADALDGHEHDVDVGGPVTYTRRRIAELAFEAAGREPRFRQVSRLAAGPLLRLSRLTGRHNYDFMHFALLASLTDLVAPAHGSRTLEAYFAELAAAPSTFGR